MHTKSLHLLVKGFASIIFRDSQLDPNLRPSSPNLPPVISNSDPSSQYEFRGDAPAAARQLQGIWNLRSVIQNVAKMCYTQCCHE